MMGGVGSMGKERALAMFADWTNRIAAGELPPAPPRPQGVERNVVITEWDWAGPKAYLHDEIATDKRNPTVNANGLLYGAPELSTDIVPVLDPVRHTATQVKMPVRDPKTPAPGKPLQPSAYWGEEAIWDSQANMHNPMFDEKGRVWFTSVIRPPENPAFCKEGSSHPSAKLFPVNRSGRQLAFYDPKTQAVHADRHVLQHAPSAVRGGRQQHAVDQQRRGRRRGGLAEHEDVRRRRTTSRSRRAGRALILDTNGNGKRDAYVEPNQPVDPAKDKRISGRVLRGDGEPGGRVDLGIGAGLPGSDRAAESGVEPAGDGALGGLRAAVEQSEGDGAGLLAARAGHRPQRRGVDGRWRAAISPASTGGSAKVR